MGVFYYLWVMEFVLDNIQEITIGDGDVFVRYKDGSTHLIEMEGIRPIKFIRGFRTELDAPILDHCI